MSYILGALTVSWLTVKRHSVLAFLAFMTFGTIINESKKKKKKTET